MLFGLLAVGLFAIGLLWCLKQDVPHLYAKAQRIVGGLLFALTASYGLWTFAFIIIAPLGCSNFEEYSALWWLFLCMGPSH